MLNTVLNLTAAFFLLGINQANAQKLGSDEATFQKLEQAASQQLEAANQLVVAEAVAREKRLNDLGVRRELFHKQEKFISCVRHGLQNQYTDMVAEAIPWVREAAISWGDSNRLNALGEACERHLKFKVRNPRLNKEIQLIQVEDVTTNVAERAFFESMLNPVTYCVDYSKQAAAGALLMAKYGAHSYSCSSSDGLDWRQTGRAVAFGLGFGLAYQSPHSWNDESRGPIPHGHIKPRLRDHNSVRVRDGGFIALGYGGWYSKTDKDTTYGISYGAGFSFEFGNKIRLTPRVITNNANEKIQRQIMAIYKSLAAK